MRRVQLFIVILLGALAPVAARGAEPEHLPAQDDRNAIAKATAGEGAGVEDDWQQLRDNCGDPDKGMTINVGRIFIRLPEWLSECEVR